MLVEFINVKCNVGQGVQNPFVVRTLLSDIFQYVVTAQLIQIFQIILSSVQQSAFVTWKEAVVVVFSLVSIEIFLSSKTLLAYSTGKGIMMFV
jgi:hypothetical protein